MEGGLILSWRLQNVVFIMSIVIGTVLLVGIVGQVTRKLSEG